MTHPVVPRREVKMSLVYGRYCQISGCPLQRKSGKKYCNKHEHGFHLKGDPMQLSIKISHLQEATREVQKLLESNNGNPSLNNLKKALGERWVILGATVDRYLEKQELGHVGIKGERKGYQVLRSLLKHSSLDEVFLLWTSFQRFEDDRPGMFVNQRSYKHQLVKHVRRISHYVDPALINKTTGLPIVKYVPEMSVPEINTVYRQLNDVFGITGYSFSKAIANRVKVDDARDQLVRDAVKGIK